MKFPNLFNFPTVFNISLNNQYDRKKMEQQYKAQHDAVIEMEKQKKMKANDVANATSKDAPEPSTPSPK